jgi:hypothetical protein
MRVLIFPSRLLSLPRSEEYRRLREHQKGQITYPFFGYYLMLASEYTQRRLKKQPRKSGAIKKIAP